MYSIVVLAIIGILDEYEQLYFHWVKLPIGFFGVFAVVRMGFEALGSRYTHVFRRRFGGPNVIYVLAILSGGCLLLAVALPSVWMIPVFSLLFLFGAMGEVWIESDLQGAIRTASRATILSIQSLVLNGSAIVLAVVFGLLSQPGGLAWGFIVFSGILILFPVYAIVRGFMRRDHNSGVLP